MRITPPSNESKAVVKMFKISSSLPRDRMLKGKNNFIFKNVS